MAALNRQLHDLASHPWCRAREFHSIHIGGGTPTTVETEALAEFIGACLESFRFAVPSGTTPEVTIEVNPNTVDRAMLARLVRAGVNRLSIGVQSFSDDLLQAIGRKHSARDGRQSFADAREAGLKNISLDLMYGLPGQELAEWRNTLTTAVDLAPEHLSVYELTVEEHTVFADRLHRGQLALPDEETVLAMFELAAEVLGEHGYTHYEISNYSRDGFECIHNLNYWANGSYLGLGSGAVSCFSGVRVQNVREVQRFIDMVGAGQKPFLEAEFLPIDARFRETIIMGLRMLAGVDIGRLEKQYGMTPDNYYGGILKALLKQDLVAEKEGRLHLTGRGFLLANRVMAQLV